MEAMTGPELRLEIASRLECWRTLKAEATKCWDEAQQMYALGRVRFNSGDFPPPVPEANDSGFILEPEETS